MGRGAMGEILRQLETSECSSKEQVEKTRDLLAIWGCSLSYINEKERELAMLQEAISEAYVTSGVSRLDLAPAKSGKSSPVELAVELALKRIADYNAHAAVIQDVVSSRLRLKEAIDELLLRLKPNKAEIIRLKYMHGHDWEYIALTLNYSESRAQHLELEAVREISRYINFGEMLAGYSRKFMLQS